MLTEEAPMRTHIIKSLSTKLKSHDFFLSQVDPEVNITQLVQEAANACFLSEVELLHLHSSLRSLCDELVAAWPAQEKMSLTDAKLFVYCTCVWTVERSLPSQGRKHLLL
jgi:hypothetical protein